MKLKTIDGKPFTQVILRLESIEPDTTDYKQRKPTFSCPDNLFMSVDVPIDSEHLANYTQWAESLLANDSAKERPPEPETVLTLKGFEYICNQLAPLKKNSQKFEQKDTDENEEWDSGGETVPQATSEQPEPKTATNWDEFDEEGSKTDTSKHEEKPENFEEVWES